MRGSPAWARPSSWRAGAGELRRPRTRRRRGGHLARQHLPGCRVRRPVAPVLVLLRSRPRVVARVRARRRGAAVPARVRPRGDRPPAAGVRGPRRRLGRARRALVADDVDRAGAGARPRPGRRPAHRASDPRRPRAGEFGGPVVHTSRWDHGLDLTGRRVGVVGTGASAVQVVPELAGRAAHVDVFQRSAAWIVPRGDRPFSPPNGRVSPATRRRPGGCGRTSSPTWNGGWPPAASTPVRWRPCAAGRRSTCRRR